VCVERKVREEEEEREEKGRDLLLLFIVAQFKSKT
jgi:hypothetical protein